MAAAAGAAAAALCCFGPGLRLSAFGLAKRAIRAAEQSALRQMASRARSAAASGEWFAGITQRLTSENTNTVDTDPAAFKGATVYQADHGLPLPYPPIADDTEAISGFLDLIKNKLVKSGDLVLNLGGGAFDGGPKWLEKEVSGVRVLTADPFRRSAEHNHSVQQAVSSAGGANVVASISVLNVIAEVANRIDHIALAHASLRPGGYARALALAAPTLCAVAPYGGAFPYQLTLLALDLH